MKKCDICGKNTKCSLEGQFFDSTGIIQTFHLCEEHHLDFFLSGQRRFIQKHQLIVEPVSSGKKDKE